MKIGLLVPFLSAVQSQIGEMARPVAFYRLTFPSKGHHVATKERLAAMAASLCAVCSGVMVVKLVVPDPRDRALELRTYVCAECGHSRTYSVDGGER